MIVYKPLAGCAYAIIRDTSAHARRASMRRWMKRRRRKSMITNLHSITARVETFTSSKVPVYQSTK